MTNYCTWNMKVRYYNGRWSFMEMKQTADGLGNDDEYMWIHASSKEELELKMAVAKPGYRIGLMASSGPDRRKLRYTVWPDLPAEKFTITTVGSPERTEWYLLKTESGICVCSASSLNEFRQALDDIGLDFGKELAPGVWTAVGRESRHEPR